MLFLDLRCSWTLTFSEDAFLLVFTITCSIQFTFSSFSFHIFKLLNSMWGFLRVSLHNSYIWRILPTFKSLNILMRFRSIPHQDLCGPSDGGASHLPSNWSSVYYLLVMDVQNICSMRPSLDAISASQASLRIQTLFTHYPFFQEVPCRWLIDIYECSYTRDDEFVPFWRWLQHGNQC